MKTTLAISQWFLDVCQKKASLGCQSVSQGLVVLWTQWTIEEQIYLTKLFVPRPALEPGYAEMDIYVFFKYIVEPDMTVWPSPYQVISNLHSVGPAKYRDPHSSLVDEARSVTWNYLSKKLIHLIQSKFFLFSKLSDTTLAVSWTSHKVEISLINICSMKFLTSIYTKICNVVISGIDLFRIFVCLLTKFVLYVLQLMKHFRWTD